MGGIAIQAYEKCGVGQQGSIRPKEDDDSALEEFQHEVAIAERLEREGKIRIIIIHKESQTGHDYVDIVLFERLA